MGDFYVQASFLRISGHLCTALALPYMEMEQNLSFSEVAARGMNNVTSYLDDNPLAWHDFLLLHIPTYLHT